MHEWDYFFLNLYYSFQGPNLLILYVNTIMHLLVCNMCKKGKRRSAESYCRTEYLYSCVDSNTRGFVSVRKSRRVYQVVNKEISVTKGMLMWGLMVQKSDKIINAYSLTVFTVSKTLISVWAKVQSFYRRFYKLSEFRYFYFLLSF